MTRKRIRHLRSNCRCPAGRFSSSTNIETLERLVFDHHIRNGDRLPDRLLGNSAIPLAHDFLPIQPPVKLFKNDPDQYSTSFEAPSVTRKFSIRPEIARLLQFEPW